MPGPARVLLADMRVEIWSDIVCPWCYVGKARFARALDGFEHRDQVEVAHRSFELDPGSPDGPFPVIPAVAAKYRTSEEQVLGNEFRLRDLAAAEGLGYQPEGRDAGNTFTMHRLLQLAKARGKASGNQERLLDLFYREMFEVAGPVFDPGRQRELAVEAGLDEDEVRAVLADPGAYAEPVRADEREAAELGATGVPFFVIDRRYGVSGAQPAEVFTQALRQAWRDSPALIPVSADPDGADPDGGDPHGGPACGPDGCPLP